MAFAEWAATMCIAREKGTLAVQMGHSSKLDRGVCSFTPIQTISASSNISKQFNRLFSREVPVADFAQGPIRPSHPIH